MIDLTFDKNDFNDIYRPYLNNSSRFLVFYGGAGCFAGHVLVRTDVGLVPISFIKEGDMVLSYSPHNKSSSFKKVLKTFTYPVDEIRQKMLTFVFTNYKIKCTYDHKFYYNGAWTPAIDIARGVLGGSTWSGGQILCEQSWSPKDNRVEGFENRARYEAGFRCQRIPKNHDKTKRENENHKNTQVDSPNIHTEPIKFSRSEPQELYKDGQQDKEFGVGEQARQHKALCREWKAGPESWGEKWDQQVKGLASIRDKKKIQAKSLHKGYAWTGIRGGAMHHKGYSSKEIMGASEIDPTEIIDIIFDDTNECVYDLTVEDNHNFCITEDNIIVHNSGKSVFIAQRYLYRCLSEPYFRLVYCRKVANTIRNSQFQLFKDLINRAELNPYFQIKEGNMEIVCENGNNMIAFGLDNREKIKSLQEPTDIWAEEATEFQREDIIQLNLRLRTKKASFNQVVLSFNPISSEHWIYDSFIVKKEFNAEILKTTYLDNRFLPPDYKKVLDELKEQDENYYKVYCLGEWGGSIKGAIYTHYSLCDHMPQFAECIYGLDFGYNHPTVLVKVGIAERNIYAQQIIYKSGLTTPDLIREMNVFNLGKVPIYCDNARPETIEELFRAGFNVKAADKGPDSVSKGIDTVKSCGLSIVDDSTDLIKEIRNYKWAEDKNGKLLEGVPVKFMDDGMDALRYAVHTHIGRPRGAFRVSVI